VQYCDRKDCEQQDQEHEVHLRRVGCRVPVLNIWLVGLTSLWLRPNGQKRNTGTKESSSLPIPLVRRFLDVL